MSNNQQNEKKDILSDLFKTEEQESEVFKILEILLDKDKNIELKTEINKPYAYARVKLYSEFLKSKNLPDSSDILRNFLLFCMEFHISKKRQSRKEIIEAFKSRTSVDFSDPLKANNINSPNRVGL